MTDSKEKNVWIVVLSIALFIFIGIALLNRYELEKYKEKIQEEKDNSCWLWVIGNDGEGIGGRTYMECNGFKTTCGNDFEGFDCEWINGTVQGCRCYG